MPVALTGALIGAAVGLLAFMVEYVVLSAAMAERTKRTHHKPEFDAAERHRIGALARFMFCVPLAFAFISWYIWG